MSAYYGRHRNIYILKDAPMSGCTGGEGSVYEIEGNSNQVAKLYHDKKFTPLPNGGDARQYLYEKLLTMLGQPVSPYVGSGASQVLTVAWPQDILMDSNGVFVGYTMPRVNSRYHIYDASRERERKQLYPNYTWKTAVIIAYNLALAVKTVHSTNAVIGDFNTNNIMLDHLGHITLIDTDSFNITNQRTGKVYKCTVGVAENLPPELQGKNLAASTSIFTQQTDNFALAIHIFSLLMNNCHPFLCSSMNQLQSSASGNPAARNIVQGNCPYVSNGRGTPAVAAPDIMMLPPELRQLFERAFAYDVYTAVQAATIARRPSAEEWFNALQRLVKTKFAVCRNPSHVYPPHNRMCPWCVVDLVRNAAKPGYTDAQYQLGLCYEKGLGVPKDTAQAAVWYRKAAERDHPKAQYQLGLCYENGAGIARDLLQAAEWYHKSAEQGYAVAQSNLALCYLNGTGVPQDDDRAVEWLRKAAEQGYSTAQYLLGWCYENLRGVEKYDTRAYAQWERESVPRLFKDPSNGAAGRNRNLAVSWYRKAAEQGHAEAQYKLAMLTKEEKWLRKAVEQGHEEALDALAEASYCRLKYQKESDDDQLFFWLRKLAENGKSFAQEGLGLCYATGRGMEKNQAKAAEWWHKAAKQGNYQAAFRLAVCYEKGKGVPQDFALAAEWYLLAAKYLHWDNNYNIGLPFHPEAEAKYKLGLFHYYGRGVKQDYAVAAVWYEKAADQGHAEAQFSLGECYMDSKGVPQDYDRAQVWYKKAANQGHAKAAFRLASLYEMNIGNVIFTKTPSWLTRQRRIKEVHMELAAKWYRKAAELGVDGAREALERVEKKIRWRW